MESRTVYEVSKEDMIEALKEVIGTEIEAKVYGKFSNITITSKGAAEILGVSHQTLVRYINENRVPIISEKGKDYKFDLGQLLKLDIKKSARVANLRFKKVGL